MTIHYAWKTNTGNIRSNNEDNLFADGIWLEDGETKDSLFSNTQYSRSEEAAISHIFAVCDGMGGASYGEVASLIAMQTLADFDEIKLIQADTPELENKLNEYINAANDAICAEMHKRSVNNMGAAIAVLTIHDDRAAVCNLGDCRVYVYDSNRLQQLSVDHRMKAPGQKSSVLSQHLGVPTDEYILEPYIRTDIEAKPNQIFLLCSDGLTDMVSDNGIQMVLDELVDESPDLIADAMIKVALACGGRDNVTVIVVKVKESE